MTLKEVKTLTSEVETRATEKITKATSAIDVKVENLNSNLTAKTKDLDRGLKATSRDLDRVNVDQRADRVNFNNQVFGMYNGLNAVSKKTSDINSSLAMFKTESELSYIELDKFAKEVKLISESNLNTLRINTKESIAELETANSNAKDSIGIVGTEVKLLKEKVKSLESNVTALATYNKSEIGQLSYFLDECPVNWLLVDGRDIDSDEYDGLRTYTQSFTLPDLKATFLRAKNDNQPSGEVFEDTTAVNRLEVALGGQHTHKAYIAGDPAVFTWATNRAGFLEGNYNWGSSYRGTVGKLLQENGLHNHVLVGDSETAPQHVVYNLCVKYK